MSATWSSDEIARSALSDMTEAQRAELLVEQLAALNGPRAITLLGVARAAISARIDELIEARVTAIGQHGGARDGA